MVIRDSNGTIKMVASRHISNVLIIIAECMALKDDMLTTKNNEFVNLQIEGDSKIVIDCYNKKSNIPSSIMLLMEDILKLSQDLYIYDCHHISRFKKSICNQE